MWRAANKVVFSKSLSSVTTARTRLECVFNADAVGAMKSAAHHDISIGGPHLAAEALKAGLVDVYHFFVAPIIIGGGTSAFPSGVRIALTLQDERRFGNGMAYVGYDVAHPTRA